MNQALPLKNSANFSKAAVRDLSFWASNLSIFFGACQFACYFCYKPILCKRKFYEIRNAIVRKENFDEEKAILTLDNKARLIVGR